MNKIFAKQFNKRALAFGWGMVMAMIIFMSTAWFAFTTTNQKISAEITSLSILEDYYKEQDRLIAYSETSSKLALSQSFYQLAKDSAIDITNSCKVINNVMVWNNNCHPNADFVKQKFLEYYDTNFNSFMLEYPNKMDITYTNVLENTTLISRASPVTFSSEKQGTFAKYNFTYNFEPSIKINLTEQGISLEDFESIYNKILECNKKIECFQKINLENWDISTESQGSWFLFKLKTKKPFIFYENDIENYAPIELNFIIEL